MNKLFIYFFLITPLFALSDSIIEQELQDALKERKLLDEKIKLLKSKLPKKKKKNVFITHTEFGYIKTGGNTDTDTFNLDVEIKKNWGKHIAKFHIDAQYAEDKGIKSKNKYLLELEYNYDLTSNVSLDYIIGYRDDEFSTYDYQFYTGPGLSYKLIEDTKQNLKLNANMLFSQDKIETTRNYLSFRSKLLYDYNILKNLTFKQTISYRTEVQDNKNYFVYLKSSLSTKLSEIFSAGLSYKYDYVSLLAEDKVHNDDTLTINLIIDY